MGIKADKTFEEIVERLVALVRPEPREADAAEKKPPPAPIKRKHAPSRSPQTRSDESTR